MPDGMDKLTWETDKTADWIPKFPSKRLALMIIAIRRFEFYRYMGYSEDRARKSALEYIMEKTDA